MDQGKDRIAALKARNPILEVLRSLGVPVAHNRIRCPRPERHSRGDRTPSVTVWPEAGLFKCWVCGDVKGDVIELVRLVRGCSFREALDYLEGGPAGAAAPARTRPRAPVAPPAPAGRPGSIWEVTPGPASPAAGLPAPPAPPAEPGPGAPATGAPALAAEARQRILLHFLRLCVPVDGAVARYLQGRRIFKRTWDAQKLRMVGDYRAAGEGLAAAFPRAELEAAGLFNPKGNLRFYRHPLIFPYLDREGKPAYLQARAIAPGVTPKELSLRGPIPCPYNLRALDGEPGWVHLCEGVIDTLTLLEQGQVAVGVPGASNFKPAWAALFRGKKVRVAFDHDPAGQAGAEKAMALLRAQGIHAERLEPPEGMDLNDWLRGKRKG